jgi:protein phosphatase
MEWADIAAQPPRVAAETVKRSTSAVRRRTSPPLFANRSWRANARIFSEARDQSRAARHGHDDVRPRRARRAGWLAHVGDSRIYLVRDDEIRQLTDDHSLVATMVREDCSPARRRRTIRWRNVLQRSMGVAEEVEVDVRGPIDLKAGDTFILCSDGSTDSSERAERDREEADRGRGGRISPQGARARRAGQRHRDRRASKMPRPERRRLLRSRSKQEAR